MTNRMRPELNRFVRGIVCTGLAFVVALTMVNSAQAQESITPPGSGTVGDPYRIGELGHLVWIGQNTTVLYGNHYFSLQNDIDASDTTNWNNGAGFVPIGTGYATRFVGVFNGNGKVIRNLFIYRPGSGMVGLFGWVDGGAQILNLGLEGGSVTGGEITGALAAYLSYSLMSNCYASASVSGYRVGGLVGASVGGTMIHCRASGAVTGGDEAGGLVGENNVSPVRGCYATGPVSGGEYVGGLFSYNNGPVSDCFATGSVTGSSTVGGLVGMNSDAATLERCYSAGAVDGSTYVGGFVGYNWGTVTNSCWDSNTSGRASSAGGSGCTGLTTEQMKQQASYTAWDFTNVWRITEGESYPELIMPSLTRIIGVAGDLSFGSVTTGTTQTAALTITNSGNVLLTVTGITYPAGFTGAWNGTLEAGGATNVTVTFAPVAAQSYSGTVTMVSDKTDGENTISASGAGVPVPKPGQICFSASSYLAQEGVKRKVLVKRINGSSGTVSVKYVMKPKTALAWQDYTPQSGTLTWLNGQTASKTITITIKADGKVEGKEAFQVLLKNPVRATLKWPYQATITILSNSKDGKGTEQVQAIRMAKLADALDGKGLTWLTSTLSPWTKQAFMTVDHVDAAISGQTDLDRVSWLQTDLEGAGKLEFDWLVKGTGKDTCLVFINGEVRRTLTPGYDWSHETLTLGEGDHTVRWVFVGDTGFTPGAAYLDQVKWTPDGD